MSATQAISNLESQRMNRGVAVCQLFQLPVRCKNWTPFRNGGGMCSLKPLWCLIHDPNDAFSGLFLCKRLSIMGSVIITTSQVSWWLPNSLLTGPTLVYAHRHFSRLYAYCCMRGPVHCHCLHSRHLTIGWLMAYPYYGILWYILTWRIKNQFLIWKCQS